MFFIPFEKQDSALVQVVSKYPFLLDELNRQIKVLKVPLIVNQNNYVTDKINTWYGDTFLYPYNKLKEIQKEYIEYGRKFALDVEVINIALLDGQWGIFVKSEIGKFLPHSIKAFTRTRPIDNDFDSLEKYSKHILIESMFVYMFVFAH